MAVVSEDEELEKMMVSWFMYFFRLRRKMPRPIIITLEHAVILTQRFFLESSTRIGHFGVHFCRGCLRPPSRRNHKGKAQVHARVVDRYRHQNGVVGLDRFGVPLHPGTAQADARDCGVGMGHVLLAHGLHRVQGRQGDGCAKC